MRRIADALIMAAGRGSRMMPLTDVVPKGMAPYNGSTLVAEGIKSLLRRIPHVHVTVGYKKAMLAQHVIEMGAASVHNTDGQCNAWWIHNTLLSHLDAPIYVLTCDNVVELDFDLLEESYYRLNAPACMLVPVRPVPELEGDYIFHTDHIVEEVNRHRETDIYCSGIQILNPARVAAMTDAGGDFYSIWAQLIQQRSLAVSPVYPKKWISIDTMDQLTRLNAGVGV